MKNLVLGLLSLLALFALCTRQVSSFEFFDSDIDYWSENNPPNLEGPPSPPKSKDQPSLKKEKKKSSFNWKEQLDPQNDDFFREGDYMPPKAFRELVKNPTDTNIKNWFKLMEKKNRLSQRLGRRIEEYLKKNKKLKPKEKRNFNRAKRKLSHTTEDYKRFRFRLYFESSCSHCKRMFKTMEELQSRGYFVELKQIDKKAKGPLPLPFPVTYASREEIKEKNINSWPVLFISTLR